MSDTTPPPADDPGQGDEQATSASGSVDEVVVADEAADGDEPGYAESLAELEAILAELEGDDVDVDVLADKVARAAALVERCRARIDRARLEVERVVAALDPSAP